MSVKITVAVLALAVAACAPVAGSQDIAASTVDARAQGRALAEACAERDGWSDPAPPARIFGNSYYVGTCGISVVLVTSPAGHVLIDGATDEAVPAILANIRALGFDPRDVRTIVGTHEHMDHMGGFAGLKAATGAQIIVSAEARTVLESGCNHPDDPQIGELPDLRPVAVDGVLTFEPQPVPISVGTGPDALVLTPHRSHGHTSGGTSWTWRSCQGSNCANIAVVDSLSAISNDHYRFTDHPERVAPYRATFSRVRRMPCDILITPHPGVASVFERLAGTEPLIDPNACRRLALNSARRLDERLEREHAPTP